MRYSVASIVSGVAALLSVSRVQAQDTYNLTLGPTSSLNATFSANAPFTGSFIGNYNATSNPTGTRTLLGAFGACGPGNQVIPLTGSGSASGNPTTTPTGAFSLTFNTASNTVAVSGLNINLLGTAVPAVGTTISVTYTAFHSCQPTGFFPSLTIPLDFDDATVNVLTASQVCSPSVGTLTPTGPGQYSFSITTNVSLALTFTFNGAEQVAEPSIVPIVFAGTATLSGSSASVSATIGIKQNQEIPGPIPALENAPFDLPNPLGGTVRLLLTVTLTNSTVDLNGTANVVATGPLGAPPCRADWNRDSLVNSQDFFDFLVGFFAQNADFNCSGVTDSQDFFDFLTAFFSGC